MDCFCIFFLCIIFCNILTENVDQVTWKNICITYSHFFQLIGKKTKIPSQLIEFPNHCKGKVNSSPKQWSFFFFRRWIGKIKSHLLNELENLWCTYLNLRYYRYLLKKLQNFFKRIYLHSVTATPFFILMVQGQSIKCFDKFSRICAIIQSQNICCPVQI